MKTLYLLRHAHAEARGSYPSDHGRPLDDRGQREAQAVAGYVQKNRIPFDFVMCSGALRTQETLEPLRATFSTQDIEISESFYNISEEAILKHLQAISDNWNTALYIGHNPGIAFTAFKLTKSFPPSLIEGVSPGTLMGFQLPLDHWKDLTWGEGALVDTFQPPAIPEPKGS